MKKLTLILLFLSLTFTNALFSEPGSSITETKLIKTLNGFSGNVYSVSFSPDGKYLASGCSNKTVKIYNTYNWRLKRILNDNYDHIKSISFSPDGKYFVLNTNKNLRIYNTNTWQLLKILDEISGEIRTFSFSPNNKYIALGSSDNTVKVYNTYNWQLIKNLNYSSWFVNSVLFITHWEYIASGSDDNTIKIYDKNNMQLIKILKDHAKKITSISFSYDGKYFASSSYDNTVKIYETNSWQLIKTLNDHSKDVTSISFSPNGKYIASSSKDNTIKIYLLPGILKPEIFIKSYVEKHINEWQKRGEFEKTTAYKNRMSKRDKKSEEFFNNAKELYIKEIRVYLSKGNIQILGKYDADRETFKLDASTIGEVVINVPINYAKSFKENEDKLKLQNPKVVQKADKFALSSVEIYNPADKKEFTYNTNVKEDYNPLADMNFEFKPYNYNFDKVDFESEVVSNIPKKKKEKNRYYLLKNMPKNSRKNRNAVAVVIGNKNYEKINNVDYAINDAKYMKKYLMDTFGYLEENIIFVPDASQGDFIGIFGKENNHKGKLYDKVRKNESDVFVYYSGHGAPDVDSEKGYFVPIDCDPATVELNGYSIDLLYNNLNKIDYRKLTVVIDACFSGESTLKNVSPIFIKVDNPVMENNKATIYLSAKGNQLSTWYPEEKHSLFTYYFLKGINKFGTDVTNEKLMGYLKKEVSYMARRLHSRDQNPTFSGNESEYLLK